MKNIIVIIFFFLAGLAGKAQLKLPPIDKSVLDMSYYPDNYPLLKIQDKVTEPMLARVIYSRPQKNERVIFGGLIEYGKVWRMGANEATEIEFYQNVKINNVKIKKGRYTLYAIPNPSKWTIILNKEMDTWGSFRYDAKKDLLRMDLPVQKQTEIVETFSLLFEKANGCINLTALWDDVKVSLPIYLQ
jgi:hypothetical protein